MGSPAFGVPILYSLIEARHEVVAVYCQPPRPAGRGRHLTPCAVQIAALELGLALRMPERLRNADEEYAAFKELRLEAAIVAAYGLILPEAMLEAPLHGCLNVHASLLPRWRGAAPIQAAILAGDAVTGISIMKMEAGLDTGPVLLTETTPIRVGETAPGLHDRLALIGARLTRRVLDGNLTTVPQHGYGITYAPKLSKKDALLDWREDARNLERRIRAMCPWPGAQFLLEGEPIRVIAAEATFRDGAPGTVLDASPTVACGYGTALRLLRLQRSGRTPQDARVFTRNHLISPGMRLHSEYP